MQILAEKVSLYDYELIVGDHGKRLLAFGKYAGRAGYIDFLHGLGQSMFCFLKCQFSTTYWIHMLWLNLLFKEEFLQL